MVQTQNRKIACHPQDMKIKINKVKITKQKLTYEENILVIQIVFGKTNFPKLDISVDICKSSKI